jgi:hypothetical protein
MTERPISFSFMKFLLENSHRVLRSEAHTPGFLGVIGGFRLGQS